MGLSDRPSLNAGAAIHIDLEAALHVPLNALAEPAVTEPLTHLEADYLMAKLHEVVEDGLISRLMVAIEEVSLHYIRRRMPLRSLPTHLTLVD